ncbi:MAG: MoxR family ATPase [Phycisphaerae bacterium]|nr:MoxR family ATPase [Phycisphaerae bacterium]MBN8598061.1 MoxR family ATPase [Planctomycetota bacterium]
MSNLQEHGKIGGQADVQLDGQIGEASETIRRLLNAIETVVIGQRAMVERLILGLLTGGHVLLEGVPGLAKTLTVNSLARGIHAKFSRIQFTPDLLPADLIGTLIYSPRDGTFSAKKGPIFANIVLADEINRAPAKVQSALLEAMQEKRVTIGDTTYPLEQPFLVLATQNPIEQEGTYPLPEAQVDRFMLKLKVGYPTKAEERQIVDRMATTRPPTTVEPIVTLEEIDRLRQLVDRVRIDDRIKDYIVSVVHATRDPKAYGLEIDRLLEFGASPRASISLAIASKGHALIQGRAYVTPADVKSVGHDVLRHRVIPSYEAQAEDVDSDEIVKQIFDRIPLP